jgi:hypothetical protein
MPERLQPGVQVIVGQCFSTGDCGLRRLQSDLSRDDVWVFKQLVGDFCHTGATAHAFQGVS